MNRVFIGSKVRCDSTTKLEDYLTKGKFYEVLDKTSLEVFIFDDSGQEHWYTTQRFTARDECILKELKAEALAALQSHDYNEWHSALEVIVDIIEAHL